MRNEVIILRTDYYDLETDELLRRLQKTSGRQIIVAADEHRHKVQIPPDISKICVSPEGLKVLNHSNFGWRCGDYFLYQALDVFPDASFFWLMEPDARIHTTTLASFFDGSVASGDVDFVTPWFVAASQEWSWYHTAAAHYPRVFNCMIQLARFSRKAVNELLTARQLLTKRFTDDSLEQELWPNDEAFIGAVLGTPDFQIKTFAEFAPAFSVEGTFTFTKPTSAKWLRSTIPNNSIYHPVVSGERFHARKRAFLNDMTHLSEVDQLNAIATLELQSVYEPRE